MASNVGSCLPLSMPSLEHVGLEHVGLGQARSARLAPTVAPRVALDVSRILVHIHNDTPTGIDRVELAYARHLLALPPERARFVAALHGAPRPVSRWLVRRLVETTERVWRDGTGPAHTRARERIAGFLSAPHPTQYASTSQGRHPVQAHEQTTRHAVAGTIALQSLARFGAPRGRRDDIYVNVSHSGVDRPALRRWLRNRQAMFLLHDLIPIRFPEFVRPDGERRHAARMETIARHGDAIMVNSDATRDALLQYVRNRRDESAIPKLKFATAPLGVEAIFQRGQSAPWAGAHPYFVCVATIEPRKNHVFLLQLWQRLVTRQGRAAPRLVLVGRRGWENENALDLLERGHGLRESVLECGALPDRVLAELVSGARALLLPSLAEGFGLPVVEALCLGTPVVASDLPALREISCGVAELLDPMDGRAWLAALGDYARQDSPRRQQQLRRLAAFRAPRWEQHFHIFDALSRAAARPAEMRRAA